jgi:hypothetical protein
MALHREDTIEKLLDRINIVREELHSIERTLERISCSPNTGPKSSKQPVPLNTPTQRE